MRKPAAPSHSRLLKGQTSDSKSDPDETLKGMVVTREGDKRHSCISIDTKYRGGKAIDFNFHTP